jgi:hypothetical protein
MLGFRGSIIVFRIKLSLFGILVIFAYGGIAVSATSASAAGYWTCVQVPANTGSWNTSNCFFSGAPYNYTLAWVYDNGLIYSCQKGGSQYENVYCNRPNSAGPFGLYYWGRLRPVPGKLGASKIVVHAGVTITCTGGKSTTEKLGTEFEGKGEVLSKETTISYEGCKATGSLGEKCEVNDPTTNELDGKLLTEGRLEEKFEPEVGTTFVEIGLTGKACTVAGKYKVTGSQTCEIDKSNTEAGETKAEHSSYCKPAGSHLLVGGLKAEYESLVTRTMEVESEESKTIESVDYAIEE